LNFQFFDFRTDTQNNNQTNIDLDRGYLFGDGFFTTAIIQDGKINHQPLHQQRLNDSSIKLKFSGFKPEQLFEYIDDKIKTISNACVRITVSRAQQMRGYAFSGNEKINVCIQLFSLIEQPKSFCELFFADTPISNNPFLAGIKHLNRLDNVFAAKEIKKINQESLMCIDDLVICGSRTNLFIKQGGVWLTPKLDKAGINGITRLRLIKLMREQDINIRLRDISKQQVIDCDAALVTNSLLGIWSVCRIGDKPLATKLSENLKYQLNIKR